MKPLEYIGPQVFYDSTLYDKTVVFYVIPQVVKLETSLQDFAEPFVFKLLVYNCSRFLLLMF